MAIVVASCIAAACGSGSTRGSEDTTPGRPDAHAANPTSAPEVEILDVAVDPGFSIGERAGAYRVTYRLVDLEDPDAQPVWEHVVVDPPFDGVVESSTGPGPDRPATSRIATTFDRRSAGAADPLVTHREPTLADADLHLAVVLDDAVAAGRVELMGQRTVQGRRCAVVRSARPLRAGPLLELGGEQHTDSCVDADGILLEEVQFDRGVALLERVAVEVDLVTDLTTSTTIGPVVVPADRGGGAVLAVEPDSEPIGEFWALPDEAIPDGFVHAGRFSVIPAQPERFSGEAGAGSPIAGVADVYRRGPEAIVVYQGATLRGDAAFVPLPDTIEVDAGRLGPAQMVLDARGSEVRVVRPGGRFVHVLGSRSPTELLTVAAALERVDGAGLVYR